jgi:hypothetical protein
MTVLDDAACETFARTSIAAGIFPAIAAQANSAARRHIAITVVILREVSIPAACVYHGVLQSLPEQPSRPFLVPAA